MKKIILMIIPFTMILAMYLVVSDKDIRISDFVINLPNLKLPKFEMDKFRAITDNLDITDGISFSWSSWSDIGKNLKKVGNVIVNLFDLVKSIYNFLIFLIRYLLNIIINFVDYVRVVMQFN